LTSVDRFTSKKLYSGTTLGEGEDKESSKNITQKVSSALVSLVLKEIDEVEQETDEVISVEIDEPSDPLPKDYLDMFKI
jgi:hypothetical protein